MNLSAVRLLTHFPCYIWMGMKAALRIRKTENCLQNTSAIYLANEINWTLH